MRRAAAIMGLALCGLVGFAWVFSRVGQMAAGWILTGVMP